MPSSESVIAEQHGYHVLKGADDQSLIFIDQATYGPIRFAGITGGLALVFVIFAVILFRVYFEGKETLPIAVPLTSGALALLTGGLTFWAVRTYQQRKARAGKRLILKNGRLEDEQGNCLAAQGELSVRIGYDFTDSTLVFRFARLIKLRWSGGQVTVFKTLSQTHFDAVMAALAQAGVPLA